MQDTDVGGDINVGSTAAAAAATSAPSAAMPDASDGTSGTVVGSLPLAPRLAVAPQSTGQQLLDSQQAADWVRWLMAQESHQRQWAADMAAALDAQRRELEIISARSEGRHNEVAKALASGAAAVQQHGAAVGAAATALEARVDQRLGAVEAAHVALDARVVAYTNTLETRLKVFEDELRGYTRDLEAKLSVLEQHATTAAAAAAAANGASALRERDAFVNMQAGAPLAETQRLGQAISDVAQRTATEAATLAMQVGAVKRELEARITAVNDVIDAVSVAAQVQETAADAQLGRLSVDAIALKSEVSRLQLEVTRLAKWQGTAHQQTAPYDRFAPTLEAGASKAVGAVNMWSAYQSTQNAGETQADGSSGAHNRASCSGCGSAGAALREDGVLVGAGAAVPSAYVAPGSSCACGGYNMCGQQRPQLSPEDVSASPARGIDASFRPGAHNPASCYGCGSAGRGSEPHYAGTSAPDPWGTSDPWSAAPRLASARRIDRWTVIFDQKEVRNVPSYNGKDKTEMWRAKMTNYLMSRAPEIARLLAWAEQQPQPIITETLNAQPELWAMGVQGALTVAPDIWSFHLWGVLNMNLEDKAWEIFEACQPMNGLEVWRRVLKNHVKKTPAEILDLETSASHPPKCRLHSEVDAAILRWEANVKKYHDSLPRGSPERLSEQKQVHALTRLLPTDIQERVLWEAGGLDTVHQLKEWTTSKIRLSAHLHRGHPGGNKLAALVASLDDDDDDETRQEVEDLTEASSEAEVNAVMARRGARRAVRAKRGSPSPPKPTRDLVCPNCLEKGHTGAQCKKPRVDNKDRKCFLCKEKGHRASECPSAKKSRGTNALTSGTGSDEAVHQFCLAYDEEPPVQRKSQAQSACREKADGEAARTLGSSRAPGSAEASDEARGEGAQSLASCRDLESASPVQGSFSLKAKSAGPEQKAEGAPSSEVMTFKQSIDIDDPDVQWELLKSGAIEGYQAKDVPQLREERRISASVGSETSSSASSGLLRVRDHGPGSRGRWPTAGQRTLGDFVHNNKFEAIAEKCKETKKNNEPNDNVNSDTLRTPECTTTNSCDEREEIAAAWSVVEKRHKQRVRKKTSKAPQRRWAARVVVSRTPTLSDNSSNQSACREDGTSHLRERHVLVNAKAEGAPRFEASADETGGNACEAKSYSEVVQELRDHRHEGQTVAFLETQDENLMHVSDEPEFVPFEVALDTGSVAHVLDKVDVPGYEPVESIGSKRKQTFVGAGGQGIANEGEVDLALVAEIGPNATRNIRSTFQVAAVTRPLWSVSCILDTCPENSEAVFRRHEAVIKDGSGKVIAKFPRKGGLYVGTLMLRNPRHPGFRGQEQ